MKSLQRFVEKILKKPLTRELVAYIIFGVATTAVGVGSFALFVSMGFGVALANTFSYVLAILFAYVTNKIWVFQARDYAVKTVAKEFFKFVSSRLLIFAIETVLLVILVDFLHYDAVLMKLFTNVIVIVLNYVASKVIVFREPGS